jgi:hypothetical protein
VFFYDPTHFIESNGGKGNEPVYFSDAGDKAFFKSSLNPNKIVPIKGSISVEVRGRGI